MASNQVFEKFGVGEPIENLIPDSLSSLYVVHLVSMLLVYALLDGMASLRMSFNSQLIKKLQKAQSENFCALLAHENHPFLVFKGRACEKDAG